MRCRPGRETPANVVAPVFRLAVDLVVGTILFDYRVAESSIVVQIELIEILLIEHPLSRPMIGENA